MRSNLGLRDSDNRRRCRRIGARNDLTDLRSGFGDGDLVRHRGSDCHSTTFYTACKNTVWTY